MLGACKPDEVIPTEAIPTAGVRFINAVPDSSGSQGLDFRFVDIVEDNAQFRITFRNSPNTTGGVTASTTVQYKNARAGARHFRIFLDDTVQAAASTVLKDSTLNLEAGKNYTLLLWGNARSTGADKMKLTVIEETVADPGNNVALRVINTMNTAIDVRQYIKGTTLPTSPTWANVGPYSISTYVSSLPDTILYNVQPTGGGTALFSPDVRALVGAAAVTVAPGPFDAIPGTTIKGSAVTLLVFPRSVAGTLTPQGGAFGAPAATFIWDRRPPRPPGT
jgi:hypothetical protein